MFILYDFIYLKTPNKQYQSLVLWDTCLNEKTFFKKSEIVIVIKVQCGYLCGEGEFSDCEETQGRDCRGASMSRLSALVVVTQILP